MRNIYIEKSYTKNPISLSVAVLPNSQHFGIVSPTSSRQITPSSLLQFSQDNCVELPMCTSFTLKPNIIFALAYSLFALKLSYIYNGNSWVPVAEGSSPAGLRNQKWEYL